MCFAIPCFRDLTYNVVMSCESLGQFVEQLLKTGQLTRVTTEIGSTSEVAEITRRVCQGGGPALLFENLSGSEQRIITNLFGTERRVSLALGADDLDAVGRRLSGDEQFTSTSLLQRWKSAMPTEADDPLAPRSVKTAACQQVVRPGRDVDLFALPTPEFVQDKQHRCLSGCKVVTSDIAGKQRHVTAVDLVIRDRKTLGIRWSPDQPIAHDYRTHVSAGEKMPMAVFFGGPPAVTLAGHADVGYDTDDYVLAGLLGGAPLEVVTCRSLALQVPAEAEVILEGAIEPDVRPFVVEAFPTPAGFYQPQAEFLPLEIAVATGRTDPILPLMVCCRPPNEKTQLQRAVDRILLPLWQRVLPELVDFHSPSYMAAGFAVVSFRKTVAHQARQIASALWGQASTMATRILICVDEDIDVRDEREVWFQLSANLDPQRDVFFYEGPGSSLSGSSDPNASSVHMALDATSKFPGERPGKALRTIVSNADLQQLVQRRWSEYGLK